VSLPGLRRPLRVRDFPSFLVDTTGSKLSKIVRESFRELFEFMDEQGPRTKVLVNTVGEMEPAALAAMRGHMDVLSVGPLVGSSAEAPVHLFDHAGADKKRYMEWLAAQAARSVVYISFGSLCTYSKQQMEEIAHGLHLCGRPFLLVLRKDGRQEPDVIRCLDDVVQEGQGLVVEWCDQLEVLSHTSVGCFVTHCGWNSTLEAMALGAPIVAAPSTFEQPTNAYLVEEEWAAGVRVECNGNGVFAGEELARCVELVMGGGARALEIKEGVEALKGLAREAMVSGGPLDRNLRSFVTDGATIHQSTRGSPHDLEENIVSSIKSVENVAQVR
jgi:hypothetical protein